MIARGWERQLDRYRNALFYEIGAAHRRAATARWLAAQAVSYVALPDAPLDYSGKAEARLVRSRPPAGRLTCARSGARAHWRLFAVARRAPLAEPPARCTQRARDSFTLRAPRAGTYAVRVRFTPYWALSQRARLRREARRRLDAVRARARRQRARRDRLLARARLRPRPPLPLSIV